MSWKGFTEESKYYMGYPKKWHCGHNCGPHFSNPQDLFKAIKFWVKLPFAWFKFQKLMWGYKIKAKPDQGGK